MRRPFFYDEPMTRFGFIGAGNMASAILKGAIAGGASPGNFVVSDAHPETSAALAEATGARMAASNDEVVATSDFVILAVKPQVLPAVLTDLASTLSESRPIVISIAAGITLDRLAGLLPDSLPVIRVMPNVNAMVGAGMAAVAGNAVATHDHLSTVVDLMESVGDAVVIPEKDFSAYTALAGSSPSWVFTFIEGLTKAGVKHGLTRPLAARIAAQAVVGSAQLAIARADELSATALSDMVCSPGGTTIAGLLAAEEAGFTTSIVAAVDATVRRDKELGS